MIKKSNRPALWLWRYKRLTKPLLKSTKYEYWIWSTYLFWFPHDSLTLKHAEKKSNCTSNITAGHHWHFFPYKNPQNFYSHQLIYSDNILLPAILLCNEAWNLFWSSILTFMDLFAFSNSACFYNVLFCFTTLCTAKKKEEKKKSSNCMSTMEEWHTYYDFIPP